MLYRVIKQISHADLGLLEPGIEIELTKTQAQYLLLAEQIISLGASDESEPPVPTSVIPRVPLTKILFGSEAPTSAIGITGDLYIQETGLMYQKAQEGWIEKINLALVNQSRTLGFFHVLEEPPGPDFGSDEDVVFAIQTQSFYKRGQGVWSHAATVALETPPIVGFGPTPDGDYQTFLSQDGSIYERQNGAWVLRHSIQVTHTGLSPASSQGKPGDLFISSNKIVFKKDAIGWQNIVTLSDQATTTANGRNLLYNATFSGSGTKVLPSNVTISAIGNTYGSGTFSLAGPLENQLSKGTFSLLAQSAGFSVTVENQPAEIKAFLTRLGYSNSFPWRRPAFAIARFTPLQVATWFVRVSRYAGWGSVYDVTVGGYIRINNPNGGPVYFDEVAIPTTLHDGNWHWILQLRPIANKTGAFSYPSGPPGAQIDLVWPVVLLGDWRSLPAPIEPILNMEEL